MYMYISPEVLVTHTKELGQILDAVHKTSTNLGRTASIPTAIAIAQLALKHRQNKNLRQRVIVFVGSPLDDTSPDSERALIRLAKKLKKNNVALDVVAFGDGIEEAGEDGHSILRAFVENASSSDNSYVVPLITLTLNPRSRHHPCTHTKKPTHCFVLLHSLSFRHYLAVPPGPHLLSSMILNSPILASDRGIPDELAAAVPGGMGGGAGGAGGAGGGAGTSQFEFGVDPTLDPELAMVRALPRAKKQKRLKINDQSIILSFPFFRPSGCLWKTRPHDRQLPTRNHHRHPVQPPPLQHQHRLRHQQ
jgi:26S proteasome regulatory subunit N10